MFHLKLLPTSLVSICRYCLHKLLQWSNDFLKYHSFTLNICKFYVRKLYPLFTLSLIYITKDSQIFYSRYCIFEKISWLNLFHLWPLELFQVSSCAFYIDLNFFSKKWPIKKKKNFRATKCYKYNLIFSLLQFQNQSLLQASLVPFIECYLETKIQDLCVLISFGVSLLLGFFRGNSQEIHISILTYTLKHT